MDRVLQGVLHVGSATSSVSLSLAPPHLHSAVHTQGPAHVQRMDVWSKRVSWVLQSLSLAWQTVTANSSYVWNWVTSIEFSVGLSFYSICFSFISSLHHLISLSLFFSSLNLSLLLPLPSFPSFSHNSKQSLTTKIWALLVKFVAGPFQPLLLSYQRSLPRLPVPRLEDTCRRVRMIVCYIYKLLLAWQQLLVTNRTEFLRKQDNE